MTELYPAPASESAAAGTGIADKLIAIRTLTKAGSGHGGVSPAERFEWPIKTGLPGDVMLDALTGEPDITSLAWDVAVWWNVELAKASVATSAGPAVPAVFAYESSAVNADLVKELFARVPRTEKRAAEYLEAAMGHVVRSVEGIKDKPWTIYDPSRGLWIEQGSWFGGREGVTVNAVLDDALTGFEQALHRACDFMAQIVDYVYPEPADGDEHEDAKKAVRKASLARVNEAKRFARSLSRGKDRAIKAALRERLATAQTWWDSKSGYLVTGDGVVDLEAVLRSGDVAASPFNPFIASTMALDARLDQAPPRGTSEWERGVAKVLPDEQVRTYLQKRFGLALLGRPSIAGKSLVWQWGPGDTGKSTLQEAIAGAKGVFAPYSAQTTSRIITKRGAEREASKLFIAMARGKRFAIISEITEGETLDQEAVKVLTGGDTVTGEAKFRNPVSYEFGATLFVATNHPPSLPPGDTALLGRLHVVPFEHRLWVRTKNPTEWAAADEAHRADEDWKDKVLSSPSERAAILRWVLDGLALFGREGLGDLPQAMRESKASFTEDADPIYATTQALLGKDDDAGGGWLRVLTDDEWLHDGLRDGDGVTVDRARQLATEWLRANGHTTGFGDVSPDHVKAVLSNIDSAGGRRKKGRVPGSTRTEWLFARLREVTPVPTEHATDETGTTIDDY